MKKDRNRGIPTIQKALLALSAALLLLIAPSMNLVESLHFAENAVIGEAKIIAYEPEIRGKAGGRREVRDYYTISYLGLKKQLLLGSRIVTSKEKVEPPEEGAPFKAGESLTILYLSDMPERMMLNPEGELLSSYYHSHDGIALLYLLKLAALILLLFATRQLMHILRKPKEGA